MMRVCLLLLCCLVGISTYGQRKKVNMPRESGVVTYTYHDELPGEKKKNIYNKIVQWVEHDPVMWVSQSDKKKGLITVNGRFQVHSKTQPNPMTFYLDFTVKKGHVTYKFHKFYFSEIEMSLEDFLKLHEDTDRETVKTNVFLATSDMFEKVERIRIYLHDYLMGKRELGNW